MGMDDMSWYNLPGQIASGAMNVGSMATDLVRGDIMGDPNYDRDWTEDDAWELGGTALATLPGGKLLGSAAKGLRGAANVGSRGATKAYNVATGAKRKAPQIPIGKKKPKVDLDNPSGGKTGYTGKKNEIVKYDPKKAAATKKLADGAVKGAASTAKSGLKSGLMAGALGLARKHPLIAGGLGIAGAMGLGNLFDDDEQAPQSETPDTDINLDNPDAGAGAGATATQAQQPQLGGQAEMAAADNVDVDPTAKNVVGRGTNNFAQTMTNLGNQKAKDYAAKEKADARVRKIAEGRDRDFLESYNRSAYGRAELGDFDSLSPEKQAELRQRYAQSRRAGAYDSSKAARQESMQRLADTGSYYVDPNDPTNENQAPGQVSRDEFMERSGMQNPGTILSPQPGGKYGTVETKAAFDRAGGAQSAFDAIGKDNPGAMANILNQVGGDNSFTFADGSKGPDMNEGTIRTPSNMQEYGDSVFQNREDALAYLNRKPNMDEPAPAPNSEPMPEEEEGNFFSDYIAPLAPYALPLLTRGKGGYRSPGSIGKPGTPFPKAPKPGPEPLGLPNYRTGLPNNPRGLPNKPAGLPNNMKQLENNLPYGLPNNRMTTEQFRRAQQGGARKRRPEDEDKGYPFGGPDYSNDYPF
jgi:hypothetical protein